MKSIMFFLVMFVPNTDLPTMVMLQPFQTAKECNAVLAHAPKESKGKFACIMIDAKPDDEGIRL